jgi:hypothetical protein
MNVRCCCQPQKILGTLDVPAAPKLHAFIKTSETVRMMADDGQVETIELRLFHDQQTGYETAVYSEERPVEFWQRFHSFKPAEQGT